jgi:perosamine synthetase
MSTFRIPFLRPPFSDEDRQAAIKVMETAQVSVGPQIQEFESRFQKFIGSKSALTCCNGSIALDLIWQTFLRTGQLKKHDKVLLPSFTFVAVANSVVNAGLQPVFSDIDPATWNLSINGFECGINNIKAICAVHTFGNPADMDLIKSFCDDTGVLLVEDCAEAAGAKYKGKRVGSFGCAASFSFNATKNMTTGEGGAIVFNGDEYAENTHIAHLLRENGFGYTTRNAVIPGYNYRLDNIRAAIGISQLKTLDERNQMRLVNAYCLASAMDYLDLEGAVAPQKMDGKNYNAVQIFGILVENRDIVYNHLIKNGIEVKKYFSPPCHEQHYYHNNFIFPEFKNTDFVSNRILCIPMYSDLNGDDIAYMVEKLAEVV